jgi:membrane protein required for colicin V production
VTGFDYAVLGILGLSVVAGLFRGALREVMSITSWTCAFLISLHFAPTLSAMLPSAVSHPWLRLFLAFVALLVASLVLFSLVTLALTQVIKKAGLSAWDRVLGVLFGMARAVVILVALVLAAGMTPLPHEATWRNAVFSPPLEALAKNVRVFLPAALAERIHFDQEPREKAG